MPNKMTDNEIIKALECCKDTTAVNCGECPYCESCVSDENVSHIMTDALDLINRLQAEKDKWVHKTEELAEVLSSSIRIRYKEAKAEAVKEFAERLRSCYADFDEAHEIITPANIEKAIKDCFGEMGIDSNAD